MERCTYERNIEQRSHSHCYRRKAKKCFIFRVCVFSLIYPVLYPLLIAGYLSASLQDLKYLWKGTTTNKVKVQHSRYKPGQTLRVPELWGSQILRQSAHEGDKVVSLTHRPPLPTRKYSWYSFLLEAESTPEPWCGRKDYVNEKLQWHHRESNPRPSDL